MFSSTALPLPPGFLFFSLRDQIKKSFEKQKCGYWTWGLNSCHLWFLYHSVIYACVKGNILVDVLLHNQSQPHDIMLAVTLSLAWGRGCSLQLGRFICMIFCSLHTGFTAWAVPIGDKRVKQHIKGAVVWHCGSSYVHCTSSAPTGTWDVCGSWSKSDCKSHWKPEFSKLTMQLSVSRL